MMPNEMEAQLAILKEKYVASLPEKIGCIRLLWETLNEEKDETRLEELHRMIHSLSGSGATFGQVQLSQLAKKLELYIKEHMSIGDMFDETTKAEVDKRLALLFDV